MLEDGGPQTLPEGWCDQYGPADEAAQTLSFTATTNNEALFSQQPTVAPDGTLTFTTAENANGEASVTVVLRDSGGSNAGGADSSPAQTFNIRVTPVNDAPTFSHRGDRSVVQDAGPQVLQGFVHPLSRGAENEAEQSVTFVVSTDEPALFAVPPKIAPDGTLSFVPRPEASGTAAVCVRLRDNGGTDSSGIDKRAPDLQDRRHHVSGRNWDPANGAPRARRTPAENRAVAPDVGEARIVTGSLKLARRPSIAGTFERPACRAPAGRAATALLRRKTNTARPRPAARRKRPERPAHRHTD